MVLVVQSFGNETEYRRAIFSVLSYYAYHQFDGVQKTILFTDNPEYFRNFFFGLPIQFELLTPERIRAMRGPIDFLHRMKIAIIEHAFKSSNESIFYADSDTFFTGNSNHHIEALSFSRSFMHVNEYAFGSLMNMELPAGQTFHDFVSLINTTSFLMADGATMKIDLHQHSWNAGVMILHSSVLRLLKDVYSLTDQFYPKTRNHASEQYAFSIVLQNSVELQPCDDVVFHYWHRVKKQIVDEFLAKKLYTGWETKPLLVKLRLIEEWTKELVPLFENHVFAYRDRAIQAFCKDDFKSGYQYAWKAFIKRPFNTAFIHHILYHTRRFVSKFRQTNLVSLPML